MLIEHFVTLYNYTYWANAKILNTSQQLSDEQFVAPAQVSHGSLRGTLVHTMSAEWMWCSRWQGVYPKEMLHEEDFPTLEAIRKRWIAEERQMRAFLST